MIMNEKETIPAPLDILKRVVAGNIFTDDSTHLYLKIGSATPSYIRLPPEFRTVDLEDCLFEMRRRRNALITLSSSTSGRAEWDRKFPKGTEPA